MNTSFTGQSPLAAAAPIHDAYRPDIDGLRAIAVLSVVLFHAFPTWLQGGFIGVDIFFVISGYLISGKIFEDLDEDKFSYRDFYSRRIRRLFPALLLVLASCLVLGWFTLLANEYEFLGKHTSLGLAFLANMALWKEAASYFNSEVDSRPLLHLWSLGIEEQFYIVWPPILFGLWKVRRFFTPIVLCLSVASFAAGIYYLQQDDTVSAFYLPWARFWELFAGALLAYALRYHPHWIAALPTARQKLGVGLLIIGIFVLNEKIGFPGWWALVPVLGAFLVISVTGPDKKTGVFVTHPVMVWFGLISYPLYLWHWPALAFARIISGEVPALGVRIAAVIVSIVLAYLTYRYVEAPLRHHRKKAAVVTALCLGALAMGVYGLALWRTDVIQHRAIDQRFPDFGKAYNKTRFSEGSCEKLLNRKVLDEEVCLTNSAEPEYLIVGDSHAMALNSAAHLGVVPIKSMLLAAHSCMLYPDYTHTMLMRASFGHNCRAVADDVLEAAKSIPSIKTIVVVQSAAVFSPEQGTVSYSYLNPQGQSVSLFDAFIGGNLSLIKRLQATGKSVVFFSDVHALKKNPLDCVSRLGLTDQAKCGVPLGEVLQRDAQYLDGVAQLKVALPGVEFYDAKASLCDATHCYGNEGNRFFFFDTHHLTPHGSERVLRDFLTKTGRPAP
ncbi:MAG: acyltransferase [Burkholderiaceae bacterium]|nr:acyltransferase [Burkholderiaceae bacterium]